MWQSSLCTRCKHNRVTGNDRGSVFYMCGKSKTDATLTKYPVQPVQKCTGFEPKNGDS